MPFVFWCSPTQESVLDADFISLPNREDSKADATWNERSPANGHDLLKPGILRSTCLEVRGDHEVVLLTRDLLSSRPAGRQLQNLGDIAPERHIDEGAIVRLQGHPRIEFTHTIWSHQ